MTAINHTLTCSLITSIQRYIMMAEIRMAPDGSMYHMLKRYKEDQQESQEGKDISENIKVVRTLTHLGYIIAMAAVKIAIALLITFEES